MLIEIIIGPYPLLQLMREGNNFVQKTFWQNFDCDLNCEGWNVFLLIALLWMSQQYVELLY